MKTTFLSVLFFLGTCTLLAHNTTLELFKNGFTSPVDLQKAGDIRTFVVEKGGRIKIVNPDGTVNPNLFLDITSQVSIGNEQGTLSLAFHHNYATNGYYFVNYTKTNGDLMAPNPASESVRFTTEFGTFSSIEIADIKGSVVLSEEDSNASEKKYVSYKPFRRCIFSKKLYLKTALSELKN